MTTRPAPEAPLDPEAVEQFAGNLVTTFTAGMTTLMIDLASRTGLLDALATAPGTSTELAERSGSTERYVRECLAALTTAGIVTYDARTGRFTLPPEHAVCLTGPGSANLAPIAGVTTLLAPHVTGVARAFREGGGVPYEAFRPEFTTAMDRLSRGLMDDQLLNGIVPQVDGLAARLAAGARGADVGCGTGHAVNLLARAFLASHFTGFDFSVDAIDAGRAEAAQWGLTNASYTVLDVAALPPESSFDVVFAFDAIHDRPIRPACWPPCAAHSHRTASS